MVDINITGTLNGTYTAFPYLRDTVGAQVVNLCSASAIYGQAELANYSATKFFVRAITEALNIEWQTQGICVRDILPLFVQTAMVKDMNAESIHKIGVHLTPEDVAAQIFSLATAHTGAFTPTHRPVGMQTKILFSLTKISPQFVSRLGNLFLAKRP